MFLDVAKESRLFQYFTRQMLQKVFAIADKNRDIMISVNLTYEDIVSPETVAYIENRLKLHAGCRVAFEILESEEIVNYAVIEAFIALAKGYGCLIAIDDFGSGYSNFAHLVRLNADLIKIDGSIIEQILVSEDARIVTRILIDFCKVKGLKSVAEYVSSPEIAEKVKAMGIDLLQGYHFGEPKPAAGYGLEE
jgi:EAL domain-containing protein (putative c-di-GMP-specific phosphodiesterase class I)